MKKINICLFFFFVCLYLNSQTSLKKYEFEIMTDDGFKLSAFSITNKDNSKKRPTILLLHGGGRNKEIWESRGVVQDIYNLGYNIVGIDIRGNGKSDPQIEGEFTYPIADAKAAISWIINNNQFKSGKIGAFGSSYGSNILISGSILFDLGVETLVLFSVTAAAQRVIDNPKGFRLLPPFEQNDIKSAFYIASDNEIERYQASEMAQNFYEKTNHKRRKKLILPGKYHGSYLYYSTKKEVRAWLIKELPIN